MAKTDDYLAQASALGPAAKAVAEQLVAHYEQELDQVTAHLGQIYEELMLLYDVGGEIAARLDTDDIATRAVERIRELLEAAGGAVSLVGGDDAAPSRVIGAHAIDGAAELLDWATELVVTRDRPLIANDLAEAGAPVASAARSLVSSPLRARGRVIGAVHVLDKSGDRGFSTQDQLLLETISSQMGVAIDNARLFAAAEHHADELARALSELGQTYDATLAALSGALDLRDNETEGHARRVTKFSVRIAQELGATGQELIDIERGALMHDIGKIGVPDAILLKPGKLTDEEWAVMRTHPVLGWQMIRNISFLANAAPIVQHHHERFDGQGYPDGLVGVQVPLGARIFAIADTFDAMTSDRPYRKALSYEVACEEVNRCSGSQFDPAAVQAFERITEAEWDAIRSTVEAQLALKRQAAGDAA